MVVEGMDPGPKMSVKGGNELSFGDLVLAKIKGYPSWPAKITKAEDWGVQPNPNKYCVHFFGTGELAFVDPEGVRKFVGEEVEKGSRTCLGNKPIRTEFGTAVDEISVAFEELEKNKLGGHAENPVVIASSDSEVSYNDGLENEPGVHMSMTENDNGNFPQGPSTDSQNREDNGNFPRVPSPNSRKRTAADVQLEDRVENPRNAEKMVLNEESHPVEKRSRGKGKEKGKRVLNGESSKPVAKRYKRKGKEKECATEKVVIGEETSCPPAKIYRKRGRKKDYLRFVIKRGQRSKRNSSNKYASQLKPINTNQDVVVECNEEEEARTPINTIQDVVDECNEGKEARTPVNTIQDVIDDCNEEEEVRTSVNTIQDVIDDCIEEEEARIPVISEESSTKTYTFIHPYFKLRKTAVRSKVFPVCDSTATENTLLEESAEQGGEAMSFSDNQGEKISNMNMGLDPPVICSSPEKTDALVPHVLCTSPEKVDAVTEEKQDLPSSKERVEVVAVVNLKDLIAAAKDKLRESRTPKNVIATKSPNPEPEPEPEHEPEPIRSPSLNYSPNPEPNRSPSPSYSPSPNFEPNRSPSLNYSPNPESEPNRSPSPSYSPNPEPNRSPSPSYSPSPNLDPDPNRSPSLNYSPNPSPSYSPSPILEKDEHLQVRSVGSGTKDDRGSVKKGATDATVYRDSFEEMIETLTRAKESIGKATHLALTCAKYGVAREIIELIIRKMENESCNHRKVDLFFLVDSITQCSHTQKGIAMECYIPAVQDSLHRILKAAAPAGKKSKDNRSKCVKVFGLWLQRNIFPPAFLLHFINAMIVSTDDVPAPPTRVVRTIEIPIREGRHISQNTRIEQKDDNNNNNGLEKEDGDNEEDWLQLPCDSPLPLSLPPPPSHPPPPPSPPPPPPPPLQPLQPPLLPLPLLLLPPPLLPLQPPLQSLRPHPHASPWVLCYPQPVAWANQASQMPANPSYGAQFDSGVRTEALSLQQAQAGQAGHAHDLVIRHQYQPINNSLFPTPSTPENNNSQFTYRSNETPQHLTCFNSLLVEKYGPSPQSTDLNGQFSYRRPEMNYVGHSNQEGNNNLGSSNNNVFQHYGSSLQPFNQDAGPGPATQRRHQDGPDMSPWPPY